MGPPRFPGTTLRYMPGPRCGPAVSVVLVLPAVVLYACCGLCVVSRRLRAVGWWVKVKIKSASGGPAQRAEGERCPVAVSGGWWGPVGCSLRLSPEATRVPPGVQPAAAWQGAEVFFRRLHSRQNPGRASPARRREHPTSAGIVCAALRAGSAGYGIGWWVRVWCSGHSSDKFFTVVGPPCR